ncbi:hypothetical protein BH11ACT6_BH11ACT6_60620 [soil metagenome]
MARVVGWMGAGVMTAGVCAALLAGAGAAHADTDTGADSKASSTSAKASKRDRADTSSSSSSKAAARQGDKASARAESHRKSDRDESDRDEEPEDAVEPDVVRSASKSGPAKRNGATTQPIAAQRVAHAAASPVQAQPIPIIGDLLGPFQPNYPPIVRAVGSAVFNLIGAIVQAADGPPVVPAELRDSIRVSSSTLVISPGNEVAADWYYPTHGQPTRMIYLQHGVLASGPMYSYTAAYLAERTNSVVVATTITSNPFAEGGLWLGGDNMHNAVAQLFLDEDRTALNASLTTATLRAGTPTLDVPTEFLLVGHSLGGGFAPGVAGHYAEGLVARRADGKDAPNHLAGAVLLDAVPFTPIMPNAMARLKQLEQSNDGDPRDYIPVYEIHAPVNFLNSTSTVVPELTAARPGKFNGVVIRGGVHMDGMLGGNPLIQAAAYLVAGFPQPQNPPAVQLLMAGWINDMFAEAIDPVTGRCLEDCDGIYGAPGSTVVIPSGTSHGNASAVVLDSGSLPAVTATRQGRFIPVQIAA